MNGCGRIELPFGPSPLKGWECPKCGGVNAPWIAECPTCSGSKSMPLRRPTTGDPLVVEHSSFIRFSKVQEDSQNDVSKVVLDGS